MRPRSRLLSKRRLLLPTIREGTEETVRDRNEANALHITSVSSEDYLLSICHLAHPTFPSRDASPDNTQHTRHLEAGPQRLRRRHSGKTSTRYELNPEEEAQGTEEKELSGELMFGNSDPLEFLYGHQSHLSGGVRRACAEGGFTRQHGGAWECQARSRAHSIPRASSPVPPRQRKSSCPELHPSTDTSAPGISTTRSPCRSEAPRGSPAERGAGAERQRPAAKQSLISQWISDCRSAWREARVRVCMLPAIAEI
ncbi:uncharacterized protein si:dkeyp-72g9.4 [Hippoglossus stenolepis]|uniref:uncharacterized protein si:dkeyp-72g9.4 n=1 Tax=Hippoglossus stenolepis TaxID=195615 RepID=UPI001FAFDBA1|nr:uncharacterized protein si:dkeyp-72g9.4 [Hippoglossus stenolepis]